MNFYINDTEFATRTLIHIIYDEELKYRDLMAKFDTLKKNFEHLHWDFSSAEKSDDFDELQVQAKFYKMAKYNQDNNLNGKKLELDDIEKSINAKRNSMDSLAMSLLQISKQGISTVNGNLANTPIGRNIGTETLKNIVWQSRNQALHCEEANPSKPVKNCFINLAIEFGSDYDLSLDYSSNKAKKIVDLLGWNDYQNYQNDMILLIG